VHASGEQANIESGPAVLRIHGSFRLGLAPKWRAGVSCRCYVSDISDS